MRTQLHLHVSVRKGMNVCVTRAMQRLDRPCAWVSKRQEITEEY